MGIGGAPEGVITAAAMRCLNGEMVARLIIDKPELEERIEKMGITDKKKIYTAADLAPGNHIIFAATGVTEGSLMKGALFWRRHAHIFHRDDAAKPQGAFCGQHPSGQASGRKSALFVKTTFRKQQMAIGQARFHPWPIAICNEFYLTTIQEAWASAASLWLFPDTAISPLRIFWRRHARRIAADAPPDRTTVKRRRMRRPCAGCNRTC